MIRLRIVPTVVIVALTLQTAHSQQSTDEKAIRAVLARETEGWDKFDPKEVASTFTEDAIWQNPFGVRLHGNAEIEKFRTGYSTNFAVIQQQTYLAEAETTEILARAAWNKSAIQLVRALGNTLKRQGITIKDALPEPKN